VKRAFVALFCASLLLGAAPQDVPRTSESIEVSIVNVDVFVTDRGGASVHGLTQNDFEIYEDGKLQPITNFSAYESDVTNEAMRVGQAPSPVPAATGEAPVLHRPRTLVIFIDRFQTPAQKSEELFTQLKSMLHAAVRPGDAVTIVSWIHRLYTRLDFTDDLEAIDSTLDKMAKERHYTPGGDYNEIDLEQEFEKQAAAFSGVNLNPDAAGGAMPTLEAMDAATREYNDMKAKTKAIKAVIESISGLEGQKSMIYVSRRFSMLSGREYYVNRHALAGPPGLYENLLSTQKEVESIAETANAHGVTMYMLYPAGLDKDWVEESSSRRMPGTSDAAMAGHSYVTLQNETVALQHVADQTGGLAAWGQQDVIKLLPRIEQDFSSYYSLAYRATTQHRDRARKIVVKAKNRAYTVRARRQFIEQSDETKMKNRVVATLFNQPDDTKIGLRVRLGQAKSKGKGKYVLPVLVEIPVQSLVSLPDEKGERGAFSVYIAWGDILGAVSEVTQRTQPFTIADKQQAKGGRFTYEFDLLTDAKANRIAIGIYDEISKDYGLQRIELPHALVN
jgi:VWFA-related protein